MKRENFDYFYAAVIEPNIQLPIKMSQDFIDKGCIIVKKNVSDKIYKFYQQKRDYVRCNYMSKSVDVALDRHKVAACMVYAILKVYPLKINRFVPNLPEQLLLANEYLAFFTALSIIETYKKDELNYQRDYEIILPKTFHEDQYKDNTYESNICKNLSYIRYDNIEKFDVLSFANIFFLLEKYTDNYMRFHESESDGEVDEIPVR